MLSRGLGPEAEEEEGGLSATSDAYGPRTHIKFKSLNVSQRKKHQQGILSPL